MSAPSNILVVDDEPDIRELVSFNLRAAGFGVEAVGSAAEALAALKRMRPQIVVLDLMLPDGSGVELCRTIRQDPELAGTLVLMLTARGDEGDRVLGFEAGADDYVVKPFSIRELVHRVRALDRRRAPAPVPDATLSWRGLVLDRVHHRVTADGVDLHLRPLEFRLLEQLLSAAGAVLTRSQLLAHAWGITADVHTRTVDTHVRRLREALGPYGDAIETVRGFGYRMRDVAASN